MKKLLSMLCLCAMLFGCSKHTPKICGFGDGGSGNYKIETKLRHPDDYVDENAPKTATVEFMGQQYTGEYRDTSYVDSNYYPWLRYETEDVNFYVKENGELCSLLLGSKMSKVSEEEILPESELIQIATNVAMQVTNVTGWNVSIEALSATAESVIQSYSVKFVKYIQDIETSETIIIYLRSNGVFFCLKSYMVGEFDDLTEEDVRNEFDYDDLEAQIIERMDEHCSPYDCNHRIVHDVEFVLTKEKKDKVVLLATDSRKRFNKETGAYSGCDYVTFIIR